jgi:hypothetical protein
VAGQYAATTDVPPGRSQDQIRTALSRYGATAYAIGEEQGLAVVQFKACGRTIRFVVRMPNRDSSDYRLTPGTRRERTDKAAGAAYEQAVRQVWRSLLLAIKAKLEVVASGIAEFEVEFAVYTVLPDGSTAADHLMPAIERAYETGQMPDGLMLPAGAAPTARRELTT